MHCSGGEKSERGVVILVHKSIVGSVVKKIVCNDRLIAVKLNAEPVHIFIVHILEEDGKVTQTLSYWENGTAL
jgi:hypothetical protein